MSLVACDAAVADNIPGDSEESPVGEPSGMGKKINVCPWIGQERANDDCATSRGGVLMRSRGGRRPTGGAGLFCGVLIRDLVSTMMDYATQFAV